MKAIVNIIGFDVDNAGQQALRQVAEAGGGEYETASSAEELRQYLDIRNTEMILNWYSWDASASVKLFSDHTDRVDELQHLVGFAFSTFDERVFLENKRMNDALDYLEGKKKSALRMREPLGPTCFGGKINLEIIRIANIGV